MMKNPNDPFSSFISAFIREARNYLGALNYQALAGDGSSRCFWRVRPSDRAWSYIAMENPPKDDVLRRENLAYLNIGAHLFRKGLGVPDIYQSDLHHGWFIMEDFGDRSLQDRVAQDGPAALHDVQVIEKLYRMQVKGAVEFDPSWCCQTERYDPWVMRHDESHYFRDAFLGLYLGMERDWSFLDGPFDHLVQMASRAESHFFLHRDFQSRNIMVSDHGIGILDWQGGRLGPLGYDLASLLMDPYIALPTHERDRLYESYLTLLGARHPQWVGGFQRSFPYLAVQRNLQILGAFSFLSRVRKKAYFEAYIPPAVHSLGNLLIRLHDPALSPLTALVLSLPDLPPKNR
jgi:aminoglycoside/choline kinase family phosphotransferase